MGVVINQFAVREMADLLCGGTFLSISCCLLEIELVELQLNSCSQMRAPVLRPPEERSKS